VARIDQTDKYTFRVLWSDEDNEFVGLCAEFASLSWLAASREAALAGIVKTVRRAVRDMAADGEAPPAPLTDRNYSGVFKVRVPCGRPREPRHRSRRGRRLALRSPGAPEPEAVDA